MLARCIAAFGAVSILSGCVAAIPAAVVALNGGELYGAHRMARHIMNNQDRKTASAQAIGGDLNTRKIKISDISTEGETERWTAITVDGSYSCSELAGHTTATCNKVS